MGVKLQLSKFLSKVSALSFVLFLLLSFAVRWNTIEMPLERDEGEYAYAAWALDQGKVFYKDFFIQKPPGIIYIYYVGQHVFGHTEAPYRIMAIVAIAITAFFLALVFASKSWIVGWCTGVLYIITISLPIPLLWNGVANTELFLNLPLSLALLILSKHNFHWHRLLLLLVSLASALLIKPTVALIALGLLSLYIYRHFWYIKGRDIRYSLGFFILFLGIVTLPITLQQAWPYLLESSVYYNLAYAQNYGLSQFLTHMQYFWKGFASLIIIILLSLLGLKHHKALRFYWILMVLGLISLFPSPIPRYYLILFPIIALLIGYVFQYTEERYKASSIGVLGLVVGILIWPWKENYGLSADEYMKCMYPRENFSETRDVSSALNVMMKPGETVYVVGSEPQIYQYTYTISPTRFITKYPLMLNTSYNLAYQLEEIAILRQKHPDWMVYCLNGQSFLKDEKTPTLYEDFIHHMMWEYYVEVPFSLGQFKLFRYKILDNRH